ncbi:GntR family transcriptional regulator [Actinopolymorpha alba]|uniref:GntR family transcriptional regulator n=1 Tax=Actinopolymorpha alba TaxID=533267 RepID=UPI0003A0A0FE|nr:GntR family transcriptional regulator [Actinopolymorpha alba]
MSLTADELFDLDPDDPRAPSQQIANALRAAILLDRLSAGDRLPSQLELCRRYGVARETVKSALRILDREQLIVSRQGSGVYVRTRRGAPLDLRDLLRSAFDRPHVTIDHAGYRGETLANTLPDALEEIRSGRVSVTSLRVRLLLVDPAAPGALPQPVEEGVSMRSVRPVLAGLTRRAVTTITESLTELTEAGLLTSASVQVRTHGLGPAFKIYLLNDERVLFGFYPVTRYSVTVRNQPVELFHPSGWDGTLFGPNAGTSPGVEPQTSGPPFSEQARGWFESVWTTIARDYKI